MVAMMAAVVVKTCLVAVQPVALGAAHVREVRVGVGFGGEGLLATAARRQQLPLFGVPPLHPAVLKPDLHLQRDTGDKCVSVGDRRVGLRHIV